jgi:hypothetical protein
VLPVQVRRTHPRLCLLPLALLGSAGTLVAQDLGTSPAGPDAQGESSGTENPPGQRFGVNATNQVQLQGSIDLDALIQNNYTDGNDHNSDHRGYGLLRAGLGTKVKIDERVTAVLSVGYYNALGGTAPATLSPDSYPDDLEPTQRRGDGQAVINEAYMQLNQFFSFTQLEVDAGRMPVSWYLREGHGAFLYDSKAYDPAVTSWDGARAAYDVDSFTFRPYSYHLPDASTLYGAILDWEPPRSGSNRAFITTSVDLERNVVLRPVASDPTPSLGSRLLTYYGGAEFSFDEFDLYGEFATQRGESANGESFDGWGGNLGVEWRANLHGGQQFILGFKGDYLSGDESPNDGRDHAFINNWSGVDDTYIVESPKYGQLSHYLQGDLEDLKATVGMSFDDHNRIRLSSTYAYFRIPRPLPGAASGFGQEGDLTLTWQYTYDTTFNVFAACFKPQSGFDAVAPAGPALVATDLVTLLGVNLRTRF